MVKAGGRLAIQRDDLVDYICRQVQVGSFNAFLIRSSCVMPSACRNLEPAWTPPRQLLLLECPVHLGPAPTQEIEASEHIKILVTQDLLPP